MLMNSCRTDRIYLPETFLLRDTLYLLQGISGKYIHFASVKDPDANQLVFQEDSVSPFINSGAIHNERNCHLEIHHLCANEITYPSFGGSWLLIHTRGHVRTSARRQGRNWDD